MIVRACAALAMLAGTLAAPSASVPSTPVPRCGPTTTTLTDTVGPGDAKTYQLRPFEVPEGTRQVEVAYTWDPIDKGVIDLGVWDARGTSGPTAFRTWSGSREGRIDKHMTPEIIAPDRNERTVVPATIVSGTWHVELGIAAVSAPMTWRVEVRCPAGPAAKLLRSDPVDPTHVARATPGWYAGDFHLHAYHSNPEGPEPEAMVTAAKAAGLDIIPVTEYVTPAHWDRLGATQRAHPEVLIWPGREVITYFGHMIVLSETPKMVEYRVGFNGITIGAIQREAAAEGGLVSIAHPTIFPPATFGSACRGCYFELLDHVDWASTNLMEIVTEGSMADLGGTEVPNPFVRTAIELWESELRAGHRLTAVSGSDSKTGPGYGKTSTMVFANELSRPSVDEALRRGHAYVRGLGHKSPTMELTATTPDGTTAMMGDTMVADTATMHLSVKGGVGDLATIRLNGTEMQRITIDSDNFSRDIPIGRATTEGPLGTFWGAEVLDTTLAPGSEVAMDIANPIFLADHARPDPVLPHFVAPKAATVATTTVSPASNGSSGAVVAAVVAAAGLILALLIRRRARPGG